MMNQKYLSDKIIKLDMNLESQLSFAIQNADEFYKCEELNLLVSHVLGEGCFKIVCYDLSCYCQQTNKCDLNEGETIKSIYPKAIEITKQEFIESFANCYNNL